MLNRRAASRITNCDVLTRKGPITLKVYREDGTSEIIPNFKASDLHLGEWSLKRTGKGWKIIYKQIGTRMDYIHTSEAVLGINLDFPLSKQDPLDKLNDLANKKRKHADNIHDYFKATKRLKSSIQYKDNLPGTMLNEPILAPVLEVENFTNWKKRFMCYIIGIEPQFENIISNGPFVPMTASQKKPDVQWTANERKAANLDQCLKSLIMSVLLDDQMNSVTKEVAKFCQSLRNTNHVKDSELASLFGKLKYEENLIDSIYETEKRKSFVFATPLSTVFSTSIVQDFQDRFSSAKVTDQTECHKCGKKGHFVRDYWSKTSIPSYQSPFQLKLLLSSENKPEMRNTKDFEAKYNKDEEEVSLDDEETEVKALMALTDEEKIYVGKESARNSEWTKITIKRVHTLLEMEDNDDRKSFLDYLCIDLNYVEEQRNNLSLKHRDLVQELNACKEQLLVLKQAKLDLLTMQYVNTEILKENQNLRLELKELTSITETWLNSFNKVNQCINEQIPTQKKKILGIGQVTEDTSSCGSKDLVFLKSLADNSDMSITSSNLHKSSKAEDSTLPNHDTNEKLDGVEPGSGPKTVKSILKSKSMFKAETLKGITLNEPSSAPAIGNKSSSAFKANSAPAGKLKYVKVEDDPPLSMALKLSQPEEPPFTTYILAICALDKPVVFKAPKTSSRAESVSQGINPRAKTRYKKPTTSSKQPSVSSKEATKGGSSKAPTGSEIGHFKRRKESSSAMDSNPIRPLVSTLVDTKMHKEDQQATGGPTSLGVTSEERANPQLSSGMSALNLNKPNFSVSFIIHPESAPGHDVLADFTAKADPGLPVPNDSIPPQQGMDEGTKNTSYDHIFVEASTTIHGDKEEASSIIKLEDLTKLVSQIQPSFKDLDSPEDDPVIIIDESDKDEPNAETEETLVPRSSSPRSSQIQELTNQLNELMVKSLQTEFSKILSSHDFSSSLPTELKDFPSKFNELTKEIKGLKTQVYELEIELPKELKEIPTHLEDFTKTATSLTSQVAELKTLYLLLNVIKALNKFVKVLESNSTKAGDQSFPSAGQADIMLAEGEKDTNQATISQLFQRRAEKIVEVEKENLNQ
ncbi:hypothetical protein Tco_1130686 [Tanacetum coccineum]